MSRPAGRRGALLGRTLRLGSLLLAGAGSLLFLALFILSSRDLDRQQQSFGHAATTEAWVVHQLAIQFQKLQRVLALAQTGAGGTATGSKAGDSSIEEAGCRPSKNSTSV